MRSNLKYMVCFLFLFLVACDGQQQVLTVSSATPEGSITVTPTSRVVCTPTLFTKTPSTTMMPASTPTPTATIIPTQIDLCGVNPTPSNLILFAAYQAHKWEIFVFDPATMESRWLADGNAPAWLSTGEGLLFQSIHEEKLDYSLVFLDWRDLSQNILAEHFSIIDSQYVWLPDDKLVLFSGNGQNDQATSLYRVGIDGSNLKKLTDDGLGNVWYPELGPDKEHIILTQYEPRFTFSIFLELSLSNFDVTLIRPGSLMTPISTGRSLQPLGDKLLFIASETLPEKGIYSFSLNDSSLKLLVNLGTNDGLMKWSPNGERIAYLIQQGDMASAYVMDANGNQNTPIRQGDIRDVVWYPDNRYLLLVQQNTSGQYEVIQVDTCTQQAQVILETTAHLAWVSVRP